MKSWTQTLRKPVAALAAVFLLVGSALTGAAAETGEAPALSASTLDWNQFLGNEELKGVSDAKTPRTAEEFKKAWISTQHKGNIMFNHISPTVIVGDYVYYYLTDPDTEVKGTVKELAEKYGQSVMTMTGFLDGINDSLVEPNPIEEMEEDTEVNLIYDKEKLYKNMVDAKADWLYQLPQWDEIFTKERQKELYLEQKKSGTIVKGAKIGRNDPCPCGSGKKYKKCCGR